MFAVDIDDAFSRNKLLGIHQNSCFLIESFGKNYLRSENS